MAWRYACHAPLKAGAVAPLANSPPTRAPYLIAETPELLVRERERVPEADRVAELVRVRLRGFDWSFTYLIGDYLLQDGGATGSRARVADVKSGSTQKLGGELRPYVAGGTAATAATVAVTASRRCPPPPQAGLVTCNR